MFGVIAPLYGVRRGSPVDRESDNGMEPRYTFHGQQQQQQHQRSCCTSPEQLRPSATHAIVSSSSSPYTKEDGRHLADFHNLAHPPPQRRPGPRYETTVPTRPALSPVERGVLVPERDGSARAVSSGCDQGVWTVF